ncbi:DUF2288 domain-containing protein [Marinicella gelatinilytica]|uniref:DUF2288 domain-containing protein n=1 Tax=Marinicella gelatinilytica TaxID=2996017 RepID=UPI002260E986|nr:DUF2288 domain-containing protein [Marinicella gelatinilytica]MCX7545216.1 DUF2288 domain-containing protein [Marinicella gelatinilytica]
MMTNSNQQMNETEDIRTRLNQERGPIDYLELQKFFAKGVILVVDPELDLIDVAEKIHADDADCISDWINAKLLTRAHDEHAKKWLKQNACFEAVTMAPWVVVQEINKS